MLAPAVGSVIADTYRLDSVIGRGAGGMVYRAYDRARDRPVALKLIHFEFALRPDSRARFLREARLARSFTHPNVVQVIDFGEHEHTLYMAMELLVGEDLRSRLDQGARFAPATIAHIGAKLADVLRAAHARGLVHRDIKPQNIFLEEHLEPSDSQRMRAPAPPVGDNLQIRVLDFGLAFCLDAEGSLGRITDEGIITGTPHYMSPEQANGDAVGPASDVYSLGCVLYELAAGAPPFSGTMTDILTHHLVTPPPPLSVAAPRFPGPLAEIIHSTLAKSPSDRPTSAALCHTLRQLQVQPVSVDTIQEMPTLPPPPKRAANADDNQPRVLLFGDLDTSVSLALRVAGLTPVTGPAQAQDADADAVTAARALSAAERDTIRAVFVPRADAAVLRELRRLLPPRTPVLTSAGHDKLTELPAYVRAGFADLLIEPVSGEDLARKLLRALRRAERPEPSSSPAPLPER
ncbi:MAG: hypothetical protein Tsb0020_31370 [Haliangiales bacterium]